MPGDKRKCEAAAGGDRFLQNESDAELRQELRKRGVLFGANFSKQELQQLLKLALENEAMRAQLQAAQQAAIPEGLGCAVCMEDFNDSDRAPRNLSCGHSSCTQCLTNMNVWGTVVCPTCRVVTRLPSGGVPALSKNFQLMYTVTKNQQLAATLKRPADDAGAALRPSKRASAASGGSVAAAPAPPACDTCNCSAHAHKEVDVLCHTCHRAVCSLCLLSTCKSHQTEAIEGIASRCVEGRLTACDGAKLRFRTAVADAANSAKVKINAKIDADAARLLAQGDALWATQRAVVAASSVAVQGRVDAALAAGNAGIAGGQGAEMLLQVVRSGGECGFEVVTGIAAEVAAVNPSLGIADVIIVPSTHELHQEGHRLLPTNPHLALQCFTRAVARGHGPSHAQLAYTYFEGSSGADKNVARAHELAAAGAALGCSDSKGVLGWLTYTGSGVPKNKQPGEQLMRESADAGSAWGQWALGYLYYRTRKFIEAARYYRMAAEQGNLRAQFRLGYMYENGLGVALDYTEAVRYYRMAAEQGHSDAQDSLGSMYEDGRGVAQDDNEALRYWRMAADRGHSDAQVRTGNMFEGASGVAQDYSEAARYYRMAAEQGNLRAQFCLGSMYENGTGVALDYSEAVRYYRMATEQGDECAQFQLGEMYRKGWGVAQDDSEAARYYLMAAAQGDSDAQGSLDNMFEDGGQNLNEAVLNDAVRYFRLAAEQGDPSAQLCLGNMYKHGRGVAQDDSEAARYYRMAAEEEYCVEVD